jgi:hypothetical protein
MREASPRLSSVGVFHQSSDDYRNVGDARAAGAEAQCAKSPKERLRVSLQDFKRTVFFKKIAGVKFPVKCFWLHLHYL